MEAGTRDVIVIGGGLIGYAAGLGLASRHADVALFEADEGSTPQASRGNFGLVWAQSKGVRGPEYARWTCRAIDGWPELQEELASRGGVDTHYRKGLGLHLCLSESEFIKRSKIIERIGGYGIAGLQPRMIGRKDILDLLPGAGPDVVGGSVCDIDGDCHSLFLHRGLISAYQSYGGTRISGPPVRRIETSDGYYIVRSGDRVEKAPKVLIAAGLGTDALAGEFGFGDLVFPQKGEILVTERTEPFLSGLISSLRQTPEGTVLIGDTKEDAGYDDHSSRRGISELARRAMRSFPAIASLKVVRSWAALRVLTRDGDPVYDESPTHPGVFVATTHSAVTLAPAHCNALAAWILGRERPEEFSAFSASRFDEAKSHAH